MEPGTDHSLVEFIKKNRWELHPIYRIAWDLAENKDRSRGGRPIASDFDTPIYAGIKKLRYATRQVFRILEVIEEMPEGQRARARKALREDYGLLMDQVFFRLFTFPYLRQIKSERLRRRLRNLKNRFEREFRYAEEDPTEVQWQNFFREVDGLCEEIDRVDKEEERAEAKTEPLRTLESKW